MPSQHSGRRTWLTISEASHLLGVTEATLRQWTDEGKIKAFITPGGHRRYSRADLKGFMGTQQRVHGIKDLVAKLKDTPLLHREIAQTYFASTPWYNKLSREHQEHLAEFGRRLLYLVVRYVTEPHSQHETMQLAREVGHDFGEELAKMGLSLTDSLEAFILHRNPVVNAAADLMKRREALNERTAEAVPLVTQMMDQALISLVAAHQHCKDSPIGSTGGTADDIDFKAAL